MKTTILRSSLAALACTAVLAIASTSMAANVNLKADLKASSEVPPTDSKGTGSVTATYGYGEQEIVMERQHLRPERPGDRGTLPFRRGRQERRRCGANCRC